MQNKGKAQGKQNGPKPVFKPYLRGNVVSKKAVRRGFKILGYYLVFSVLCLLIGGVLNIGSLVLRLALNLVFLGAGCALLFSEGSRQGEADVAFAEIAQNRLNEGKRVPDSEKDGCFHPGKGFFTGLAGILPIVLIAAVFAVVARKQFFTLGSLPGWVNAYQSEAAIGQPLAYYGASIPLTAEDVLRLIVRFFIFPFVNIVGTGDIQGLYLMDKLSPLLCLPLPLCYALGYLRGPYLRALVHGSIRQNRRRQSSRERKARQARAQRGEQKKELI